MFERIKNLIKKEWWFVAALLVYSFFVLYKFFAQGLVNWDESYFMIPISTYGDFLRTLFSHPSWLLEPSYYREIMAQHGNVYTVAKPSFILAGVLVNFIWHNEFSSRLISFLAGLGVLFLFRRILDFYSFSRFAKMASVWLLAFSPLFILFGRLGLAPMFSAFFLFLMFYELLSFQKTERWRDLSIFSVAAAFAIMSHYSLLSVIGVFFLYAIYLLWAKKSSWLKYGGLISAFLVPILGWELITRVGVWLAESRHFISTSGTWGIYSHFQEFAKQMVIARNENTAFPLGWHSYYFDLLAREEGWIILFLILVGLAIFVFRARQFRFQAALVPPLIFLIILSAVNLKFPRTMMPVFPFLFVWLAAALDFTHGWLEKKIGAKGWIFLIILLLSAVFLNLPQYKIILNLRTGFHEAAKYIQLSYKPQDTLVLSSVAPAWRLYLKGYKVEDLNRPEEWTDLMATRKVIVISDQFTKIIKKEDYPLSYPADKVFETASNVFLSRPVIMDVIFLKASDFKKMFNDNKDFHLKIYEIK